MFCSQCGTQIADGAMFCHGCGNKLEVDSPVLTVEYAGFWRRFVAYIVDRLILGIPALVIVLAFLVPSIIAMVKTFDHGDPGPLVILSFIASWIWLVVLFVLGYIFYFAWFESSRYQATPGKMMLGIVVTNLAGGRVSFLRSLGRNAGKIFSHMVFHIGFILAGLTEKKQALHDLLADCLVVMKPRL